MHDFDTAAQAAGNDRVRNEAATGQGTISKHVPANFNLFGEDYPNRLHMVAIVENIEDSRN